MLRKGIALAALSLAGVAALAPTAQAQTAPANPWELELGASASNGPDVNGFTAAGNASIGYYFNEQLELSLRQSLSYTDIGSTGSKGSALNASTRVGVDYHFTGLGSHQEIVPFVGANIGYVYGDTVKDQFEGAPEAGVKIYVNEKTFIFAEAEYQFFFNQSSSGKEAISNGQFVYELGIGFRF